MTRKKTRKPRTVQEALLRHPGFLRSMRDVRAAQSLSKARKDEAPVRGTRASGVDTDGVLPASSDLHPEDSPPTMTATSGTVDFCTVCGGQHDHRDPQPH